MSVLDSEDEIEELGREVVEVGKVSVWEPFGSCWCVKAEPYGSYEQGCFGFCVNDYGRCVKTKPFGLCVKGSSGCVKLEHFGSSVKKFL